MGIRKLTDLAVTCLGLIAGGPALAGEIHVYPGDSIQAAIGEAEIGDEVIVHPGTYYENINLGGKAITVRSTDPEDPDVVAGTVIDGNAAGPVVTCSRQEGTDTVLSGLTITNGYAENGGGMCNDEGCPTVTYCVFVDNIALADGGGMYNLYPSPVVSNCSFIGNQADDGGGMFNKYCDPIVTDCLFTGNAATYGGGVYNVHADAVLTGCDFSGNSGRGGGVYGYASSPRVTDCLFTANFGLDLGGGGMFNREHSDAIVVGCRFVGNYTLNDEGGGMYNWSSAPTILNCLFQGNYSDRYGGALYNTGGDRTLLANCTFYANVADIAGGAFCQHNGQLTASGCIMWGNGGGEIDVHDNGEVRITYCDIQGGYEGVGNIETDPRFVDPANGDFHLSVGSPCIDAGFNNVLPIDSDDLDHDGATCERLPIDLDGGPRFADDEATDDTGCGLPVVVDMGAFEFAGLPADVGYADVNADGTVDIDDLFAVLADWGECSGCCLGDLDGSGAVNIDDIFAALGNWGPCP